MQGVATRILNATLLLSLLAMSLTVFLYMRSDASRPVYASAVRENYYQAASGDIVMTNSGNSQSDMFLLELPVKSIDDVAAWCGRVAVQLFSVSFFGYDEHYAAMRDFFTDDGWRSMRSAIYSSGWLNSLIEKKLTSSAVITGTPVNGFYTWLLSFPVLVTYESASQIVRENRVFTVQVKRVPADFEKGQAGIAIESIRSEKSGE